MHGFTRQLTGLEPSGHKDGGGVGNVWVVGTRGPTRPSLVVLFDQTAGLGLGLAVTAVLGEEEGSTMT